MSVIVVVLLSCLLTWNRAVAPYSRFYGWYQTLTRACENNSLTASCTDIFRLHIVHASYGRNAGNEICPHHPLPVTSGCHSEKSLSVVRGACQGKESCTISATSTLFGDPCPGTYKYLEVAYYCG